MSMRWMIPWVAVLWACMPDDTAVAPEPGPISAAIVNGTIETGWPAVGALTLTMQGYYIGEFCTGTLIAPQWVLTAAHCVTPSQDFPVSERATRFFIGNDASPARNGGPPISGTFYGVEKFYPHPQYRASDYEVVNDVALVKLSTPVSSVTPIDLNVQAMGSSYINRTVLYVGFGNSDGYEGQTNGIKRSGTMKIVGIGSQDYTSVYGGQGVCAGDSGGPGLVQVGDQWVVIGVNSTVGNPNGGEPCMGYANHMRVDVFAPWLTSVMDLPAPDCRRDPAVCECGTACQADGSCNNDVCQTWSCEQIYDCVVSCSDQSCVETCVNRGTSEGKQTFLSLVDCLNRNCGSAGSDQNCAVQYCSQQIDACFPGQTGDLSCEDSYDCMVECNDGDRTCLNDCWSAGSSQAQQQLGALFTCFNQQCGSLSDVEAWRECVRTKCRDQILACMPPTDCDLRGGGCPAGQACAPWLEGHSDCWDSLGGLEGTPCDPDLERALPCGDGLYCQDAEEGAVCVQICQQDQDCSQGARCVAPVFPGRPEGFCEVDASCVDEDEDGVCADLDCNDLDPTRHPGAQEACENGVDDDCDGQTDEDCPVGGGTDDQAPDDGTTDDQAPDDGTTEDSGPGDRGGVGTEDVPAGEDGGLDVSGQGTLGGGGSGGCAMTGGRAGGVAALLPWLLLAGWFRRRIARP